MATSKASPFSARLGSPGYVKGRKPVERCGTLKRIRAAPSTRPQLDAPVLTPFRSTQTRSPPPPVLFRTQTIPLRFETQIQALVLFPHEARRVHLRVRLFVGGRLRTYAFLCYAFFSRFVEGAEEGTEWGEEWKGKGEGKAGRAGEQRCRGDRGAFEGEQAGDEGNCKGERCRARS